MRPSKPGEGWLAKAYGYGYYMSGLVVAGAVLIANDVRWGWPAWVAIVAAFTAATFTYVLWLLLGAFGLAIRDVWWEWRLRREAQGRS